MAVQRCVRTGTLRAHAAHRVALLLALLLAFAGKAHAEAKPLWVAVTRSSLEKALEPLAEKRRGDGFEVVVSTERIDKALKGLTRAPDYILIVGDCERAKEAESWYVPTRSMPMYRWTEDQPKRFASDAAWGDLDSDGVPDVPVGRIPARTAEDVRLVVRKILAYETREPTVADLRVPVWAGAMGFGPAIDSMINRVLLQKALAAAPAWTEAWVICSDETSPFCGWPPSHASLFNDKLKQGSLLAAMVGHANRHAFASMRFHGKMLNYTPREVQRDMAKGSPTGPLVILACLAGDFTGKSACLGEWLLGSPGGPVAVVAATVESHPLTNYYSGISLMEAVGQENRIGALWLEASRRAVEKSEPDVEILLGGVEGKLDSRIDVAKLKRDQSLMYAILGDPATLLFVPTKLVASLTRDGDVWRWKAEKPEGAASLHVALKRPGVTPTQTRPVSYKRKAQKAFREANASYEFKRLDLIASEEPWEGSVSKTGILRLVAVGPGIFQVATFDLESPSP